jgi:hypothetical protein
MEDNMYYETIEQFLKSKVFSQFEQFINDGNRDKLQALLHVFPKKILVNRAVMIKTLLQYSELVEGDWVENINNSSKYGRDSSSYDSMVCRYGKRLADKLFEEKKYKCTLTKQTLIDRYGESNGTEKWESICRSKVSWGRPVFIRKYGNLHGETKWRESLDKKIKTQNDRRVDGVKYANGHKLSDYERRYGMVDGYKRWSKRNAHISYMGSLQRYIDEFGESGREICRKIKDNTSLESFRKRYGESIGNSKYIEHVEKLISCTFKGKTYSKKSQRLFWSIYEHLTYEDKLMCKFYELNGEQSFLIPSEKPKLFRVDFKIDNVVIEFNGDYWHGNPNMYNRCDFISHPGGKRLVNEIWEVDKSRVDFLKSIGYIVMTVWESDYNSDSNLVLENCLKVIRERS